MNEVPECKNHMFGCVTGVWWACAYGKGFKMCHGRLDCNRFEQWDCEKKEKVIQNV